MSNWAEAGTWTGEDLHREVFFFGPPEGRLYGSLYSAAAPSRGEGVLVCPSWGYEADRTERLAHFIALTAARLGGAGMVFHYPGYGDSHGASLADATMGSLALAAVAALAEAAGRRPGLAWFPAGLMLGATVALLAAESAPVSRLLLVQPALSPHAYFAALEKSAERDALGPGRIGRMAFAYPLPDAILAAGEEADAPVRAALSRFGGDGAVVRHEAPAPAAPLPGRFAELTVEGHWRFGSKDCPALERGVAEWLRTS